MDDRQPLAQTAVTPNHELVATSSWQLPTRQAVFLTLALITAVLIVYLRLVQLDTLQAEIYNDIVILWDYVADLRRGHLRYDFVLSAGPLYHYLAVPIVALIGLSYLSLKLVSVLVSLGTLLATYGLSRRLIDDEFALLATFIAGVSSWLLIFSRLGNSQILVPALTTSALWLAVRAIQRQSWADLIACAVVSALGLYVYPQSFILPAVVAATLVCLRWAGQPISWRAIACFVLLTILLALPFFAIVYQKPATVFGSYVADKLDKYNGDVAGVLLGNVRRALLALHVSGDAVFRSNPQERPHLDPVSGLLLLGGVVYWLRPGRRQWGALLLLPLLLLQLPSMLVLAVPAEVPSAARTLAIAPLAYILAASGLWWLIEALLARGWHRVAPALGTLLLCAVLALNIQRYFGEYVSGLPYHNTPIGREIADYLDMLPADTQIYMVGCCWQDEMPLFQSVQYAMARPQNLHAIDPGTLRCDQLASLQPGMLIWSFKNPLPAPQLAACRQLLTAQLYSSSSGLPIFYAAPLLRR